MIGIVVIIFGSLIVVGNAGFLVMTHQTIGLPLIIASTIATTITLGLLANRLRYIRKYRA